MTEVHPVTRSSHLNMLNKLSRNTKRLTANRFGYFMFGTKPTANRSLRSLGVLFYLRLIAGVFD